MSFTDQGMPTDQQLIRPVLQAVAALGGSAKTKEIIDHVAENYPSAETLLQVTYPARPEVSVFTDRTYWSLSLAKHLGALEQPSRGMYLTTDLGEELLSLSEEEVLEKVRALVRDLNREYNRRQQRKKKSRQQRRKKTEDTPGIKDGDLRADEPSMEVIAEAGIDGDSAVSGWKTQLLERLHKLPPEGFEKFVLYLLRRYGLELTHVGGSGDEGIDGIGTAPLSPVLSSRVAVQVKRYAPNGSPIDRGTVALFQRDARAKAAERAILVTLSRFTKQAREAAEADTPTVDLIDGDRLADLIREDGESGVSLQPTVNEGWFDKFD